MKAAQIISYGDASVITINEVDAPKLENGHALVDVYAASINPFDIKLRSGVMKDGLPLTFPFTLGGDFSGIVSEVGEGVSHIKEGDRVFGQSYGFGGSSGAFADMTLVNADHVAVAPSNCSFEEASTLPLVGASALQALTEHIAIQPGQKLFIHGGGGAIGSIAIQIAKYLGAYVATTATDGDLEYVKQLGADEILDYKELHFAEVLHDFDAVFDTVGGDDFTRSLAILKKGGTAVSMVDNAKEGRAEELGVHAFMQMTHTTTDLLNKLRYLVEGGVVTARIGKVFSFAKVREAFETRESGHVRGKVVISIKS